MKLTPVTPLLGTLLLTPLLVACKGESNNCRNFPVEYTKSSLGTNYNGIHNVTASWNKEENLLQINQPSQEEITKYYYASKDNFINELDIFAQENFEKKVWRNDFGGVETTTTHARSEGLIQSTNISTSDHEPSEENIQWLEYDDFSRPIKGIYSYISGFYGDRGCSNWLLTREYDDEERSILSIYNASESIPINEGNTCRSHTDKKYFNQYGLVYKSEFWRTGLDTSVAADIINEYSYQYQKIDSVCIAPNNQADT